MSSGLSSSPNRNKTSFVEPDPIISKPPTKTIQMNIKPSLDEEDFSEQAEKYQHRRTGGELGSKYHVSAKKHETIEVKKASTLVEPKTTTITISNAQTADIKRSYTD